MRYTSKKEFMKLAGKGFTVIPVYKEILADQLTPVSAFLRLRDDYSYLLESVEGEEKIARFSFIGVKPSLVFRSKGTEVELIKGASNKKFTVESPLKTVKKLMRDYKAAKVKGLPRFFGGLVGYMGYDTVRFFEDIPDENADDLKLCDCIFTMADNHVIFDHAAHKVKVVVNVYLDHERGAKDGKQKAYRSAIKRIDKIIRTLNKPQRKRRRKKKKAISHKIKSNFTKAGFEKAVKEAKKYIRAGDIIQAVLSQRFHTKINCDPLDVYRALRSINPSSYMYYLNFGNLKMAGASPELLVRCEDGKVETRPIAGTRPRGKDENDDGRLAAELLSDKKEVAEHVMLVDLGRNDIGRVCKAGTVHVSEFMFIEKYSHVMHIVSNCVGELAKNKDAYDVLKATFPAGTLSGAPKIRAMEIIDELENTKRGAYGGAVGYFSFSGNMDTCINIRTIVFKKDRAYIQAGAGIVADSVPSREYQETVNKAKAMIKAIEAAEEGLD